MELCNRLVVTEAQATVWRTPTVLCQAPSWTVDRSLLYSSYCGLAESMYVLCTLHHIIEEIAAYLLLA